MNQNRKDKILMYANRIDTDSDPVSIQAGLTDFCFNNCHMCGHHQREDKKTLPVRDWINFLNDHPGIESVCYSGGDAMANHDMNDIMNFHIDKDMAFGFITAGFFPDYIDLNLLKKARWVRCSLDSIDADIYSQCRGGISLDKIWSSIKRAKLAGVNIEFTITVSELSKPGLGELFRAIVELGCNADIHPIYGSSFEQLDISKMIIWAEGFFADNNLVFSPHSADAPYPPIGNCKAPYYQIFVDSSGDIYPCCVLAGDTEKDPVSEPIGSIYYWDNFLETRKSFCSDPSSLPAKLCTNCVQRFREINQIANSITKKKNFF